MTTKTYKRETAGVLFLALAGAYVWGILGNSVAFSAAEILTAPVFLFGASAFGLDAMIKSGSLK